MQFQELGLTQPLLGGLSQYPSATPVQEGVIPPMLAGKDVIAQWQTGSGKTLAYLLPLYQRQEAVIPKGAQAIILVPTRELAMQIHHEVQRLSRESGIGLQSVVLFGNVNINTQIERLKEKPQIIIGTCERVLALIQKKKIAAHTVKTFLVDEADKLLDKQSISALKAVRKTCMKDTQTVMVSATFAPEEMEAALKMTHDPVVLRSSESEIPPTITHQFLVCDKRDKLDNLRRLIRIMEPPKSMIFINDLEQINLAVQKLQYHEVPCDCIHSDSSKEERRRHLTDFKEGKLQHLVTTDLGARGLHIDDVPLIFHVDIAESPTDYLHRAGRTGRSGKDGLSICFISPHEEVFLKKYRSKLGVQFEEIATREGEIYKK
ncbi:MAG: DEAD/DEAH box helicase [Eubacteriales bacterium]